MVRIMHHIIMCVSREGRITLPNEYLIWRNSSLAHMRRFFAEHKNTFRRSSHGTVFDGSAGFFTLLLEE
jgi:hypothetical protein